MNTMEMEELDEAGNVTFTYVHSTGMDGARIDVIVCWSALCSFVFNVTTILLIPFVPGWSRYFDVSLAL